MKEVGLHWRNHFYEAVLGTVLATASELRPCRGQYFQNAPVAPSTDSAAMLPAELDSSSSSSPCSVQTSSAFGDDVSHCPDPSCNASFTGSSQKTNLKRHLKWVLHHNQDAQSKCDLCQKTICRSDNLKQHMRNMHGVESASKSQTTRGSPKRRRAGG